MAFNNVCSNCGEVDNYTTTMKGKQNTARCNKCNNFMGNKPYIDIKPIFKVTRKGYTESYIEMTFRTTYERFKNGDEKLICCDPEFNLLPEQEFLYNDKTYYIDFLEPKLSIAIELDGEGYHWQSKDIIKQNALTMSGYRVLRYTGSDINNNAIQVLSDIYKFYLDLKEGTNGKAIN